MHEVGAINSTLVAQPVYRSGVFPWPRVSTLQLQLPSN